MNSNCLLPDRWSKLRKHEIQQALWNSNKRFAVVPAGRRSGKTELAKRRLILDALKYCKASDGRFIFSAPTHTQAKKIFWDDLKAMVPPQMLWSPTKIRNSISESALSIKLWNGCKIEVVGLDRPERAEGSPIDGIVLDEYGNMKPEVWTQHIRPGLSTLGREGWAWFIGVPEGRNHYYQLFKDCELDHNIEDWGAYTWKTADINPAEAAKAKRELDLLTYMQEYEGSFVTFEGRCYYAFDPDFNVTPQGERLLYQPDKDLILTFDFNKKPGTCGIWQEQESPEWLDRINKKHEQVVTCGLDEIYIEHNSNTEVVCEKIIEKWRHHTGMIKLYGDASGGAAGSAKVKGSDWEIIDAMLEPIFPNRILRMYPKSNPRIRARVNSVNSRFRACDGTIRAVLDRKMQPMHIRDFEGVVCDDHGDPDKKENNSMLTHLSDAFGYYVIEEFPVYEGTVKTIAA